MWLSAKKNRDEEFYSNVCSIIDLYTRPIMPHEVVLSVDEKTSLQPRPGIVPQNLQSLAISPIYMNMNTEETVH